MLLSSSRKPSPYRRSESGPRCDDQGQVRRLCRSDGGDDDSTGQSIQALHEGEGSLQVDG